jgi:hypothetical protein
MDAATRQLCLFGRTERHALASDNSQTIGGAQVSASAMGKTREECSSNLGGRLAQQASAKIGQQVQSYWRKKALAIRDQQRRACHLQRYLAWCRAGYERPGLRAASRGHAAGRTELGLCQPECHAVAGQRHLCGRHAAAIRAGGKLRENPAFANLSANVEGASVLLCVGPCQ